MEGHDNVFNFPKGEYNIFEILFCLKLLNRKVSLKLDSKENGLYSITDVIDIDDIKHQKNIKRKFYYQSKQKQKTYFKKNVIEELMMKIFHPKNILKIKNWGFDFLEDE